MVSTYNELHLFKLLKGQWALASKKAKIYDKVNRDFILNFVVLIVILSLLVIFCSKIVISVVSTLLAVTVFIPSVIAFISEKRVKSMNKDVKSDFFETALIVNGLSKEDIKEYGDVKKAYRTMFAKFNRSLYRPVYKRLIIDAYEEMFMIQDHLINISSVLDEVYATFEFVVSFNKYLDNIPAVVDSELGKIANIDPKLCQLLRGDIFTGIRLYNSGMEIPKMELELLVCRSPRYFSKIQDYLKMMTPENENLIPSVVD